MRNTPHPEPRNFPDPQVWATWQCSRNPQFKTHSTLGMCKGAIAGKVNAGKITCDCYVYKWDDESLTWVEQYFLPKGDSKDNSPLFQTVVRKGGGAKAPSKKAIDAAIASISGITGGS